jgi:hypothetical protein
MAEKEPKDLILARRGYEAFWNEQPQIWFDQLSHDYIMRWVRVARAIMEEVSRSSADKMKSLEDAHAVLATVPRRKNGRLNMTDLSEQEKRKVQSAKHYISYHKRRHG